MEKSSYWILAPFIIIITFIFAIYMQAPLSSHIAPVGMLALVLFGSFLFFLYTIKYKRYPFIILKIIAFAFFASVSTFINNEYMDISNLLMTIVAILFWIIIFIVSYIVTRKSSNISQWPFYMIALTLPFIAYSYFLIFQVQVNSVYYVLLFLPIILTIEKSYIKVLGILVICASIIVSLKRTALIAFLLALFVYFLVSIGLVNKQKSFKKMIYILSFLVFNYFSIIFLYTHLSKYFNLDWILRMQSLQTDGGSNRDVVWATTVRMQFNSNVLEWLFGHGYDAVVRDSPLNLSAHNDFLEVLYDYGVFAFALYIGFIISLVKMLIRMYRSKFILVAQFASGIVIFLVMSTTSHLVAYPTYFIYLAFFWGISIAQYENCKKGLLSAVSHEKYIKNLPTGAKGGSLNE